MSHASVRPLFDRLLEANQVGVSDFCRMLREVDDTATLTPGGQWTVRENAVHLIGGLRLYRRLIAGQPSPIANGWDELTVLNTGYFLGLDEPRPAALADLLTAAADEFSRDAAALGGVHPCPFHLGLTINVQILLAVFGAEVLMHGWDMAVATGQAPNADPAAHAVVEQLTSILPGFLEADLGEVTLALRPDGLVPQVYRYKSGAIEQLSWADDGQYDCTIAGPPMRLLLLVWGRQQPAGAGLAVSGLRPELAARFRLPPI